MMQSLKKKSTLILILFIMQVIINWVFVIWVENHSNMVLNAWIALQPLFAYFYVVFAIIACIEIIYDTKLGLALAYCITLVGMTSAVISYDLVLKQSEQSGVILLSLLAINAIILFLITYFNATLKSE